MSMHMPRSFANCTAVAVHVFLSPSSTLLGSSRTQTMRLQVTQRTTATIHVTSLPIAEGPAESGAGAVVAAGQCGGRLIIPATIKRKVPLEIANNLEVVDHICIEM